MLIARDFAYLMCLLLRHSGFFSSVTSPKTHVDRSCTLCSPCRDPFGLPVVGVFFCRGLPWPNYQSPIAFLTSDGQEEDWLGLEKSTFTGFVFVRCTQLYFASGFVLLPRLFVAEAPFSFPIKATLFATFTSMFYQVHLHELDTVEVATWSLITFVICTLKYVTKQAPMYSC